MKPILFSTDMVRAILDGRKTHTRRLVKPQPPETMQRKDFLGYICGSEEQPCLYADKKYWTYGAPWGSGPNFATPFPEPRYQPGDILYVRETWARISDWTDVDPEVGIPDGYIYRADWRDGAESPKWRPSIHMPCEAARIFLLVDDVRPERLQEITEEDAWAEGCNANIPDGLPSSVAWFYETWNYLNASRGYGWDTNPWVWVIEFSRTEEPSCE